VAKHEEKKTEGKEFFSSQYFLWLHFYSQEVGRCGLLQGKILKRGILTKPSESKTKITNCSVSDPHTFFAD
jgi:hypothetical protein